VDVIALSKANKAKKAMKQLTGRLGMEGTESGSDIMNGFASVKARLDDLDTKNPSLVLTQRVSNVESATSGSLSKHNLKINSVTLHQRYKLKDMTFDDLADATTIDATKSIGYVYDGVGKKVIVSGGSSANIVTTKDTVLTIPQMMILSYSANTGTQPRSFVSRDDGITWKEVQPDVLTSLDGLPSGRDIRVKFQLESGQEILAYSYSWI
jgi:hypothetical protein